MKVLDMLYFRVVEGEYMKNISKVTSWVLVILWIAFIFYLSHQPATQSNKLSKQVTQIIVETVGRIVPDRSLNIRNFNHIVRKNAHFFAYLFLGVLVYNGLRNSGIKGYRKIVLALVICIVYAITDEVHQLFIPGRGGQIKDVIIDSSGAFVGIISCKCFSKMSKRS